jgi:hypothetical protein
LFIVTAQARWFLWVFLGGLAEFAAKPPKNTHKKPTGVVVTVYLGFAQ